MNRKNIIFGRLVDGMDAFDEMEKVGVDSNGLPVEAIRIEDVHILANPCKQATVVPTEGQVDELDTQQMDIIDGKKRKQRTHSLEAFHEVNSF